MPMCSPSTIACCGSFGRGIAVSRSIRRVMRSSSPSLERPRPLPPPPTRSARLRTARCVCGWGCTPANRSRRSRTTSASTSTVRRGSQPPGTAARCSCRKSTADLAGADVRDLGLHRLKDLSAPERLFQLGTEVFPPLKTLHETNLPVPATPFLGREREIDEIAVLLRRPEVRIVTLTGPGGSGKTRLSLQAAAAAADDYDHGVWWVPLASLADPALVETAAAQALGSKDTLAATVGDKRLLLVLDNFEHLLDAAAGVAETIGACPRLTVLVTSREPLHVDGEWEVAVDPLREREAVELFVQRAAAVRSDFAANGEVAEICRRLDCLPLAIELAAARVKALSLPVLLERLEQRLPLLAGGSRSAPERQRTLRATIAWSHDLLTPAEQDLFARLAVFAGGCTLEAAEEICGADLDAIASLVDKSLLRRTGDRYWMLETIREFAAERLDELAGRALSSGIVTLPGTSRSASARALSCRRGRPASGSTGSTPSTRTCGQRSSTCWRAGTPMARCGCRERSGCTGRRAGTGPRAGASSPRRLRSAMTPNRSASSMRSGVQRSWRCGRATSTRASSWPTRLLELSQTGRAATRRGRGCIHLLAIAALQRGDRDRARALNEESLALARGVNDGWLLSVATNNLGDLLMEEGEYERAARAVRGEPGDRRGARRPRPACTGAHEPRLRDTRPRRPRPRTRALPRRLWPPRRRSASSRLELWALLGIACVRSRGRRRRRGSASARSRQAAGVAISAAPTTTRARSSSGEHSRRSVVALAPERLAAELAAGAALSLEEAIDLALGRSGVQTPQAAVPTSD